jgi:hypothetical protein
VSYALKLVQSASAAKTAEHYNPFGMCMIYAAVINPGLLAFIEG